MASSADLVTMLLGLAAIVATVNHRFVRMPRAVALLLGSLSISGLIWVIDPFVTTDLSGWVRRLLACRSDRTATAKVGYSGAGDRRGDHCHDLIRRRDLGSVSVCRHLGAT